MKMIVMHPGVQTSILSYAEHEKVIQHVFTNMTYCLAGFPAVLEWLHSNISAQQFYETPWPNFFDTSQPGDDCLISFIIHPYTHKFMKIKGIHLTIIIEKHYDK